METSLTLSFSYWTTVGKSAALNQFLNRRPSLGNSYQAGPVSDIYFPIFESPSSVIDDEVEDENKLVGVLTAYVYWQVYFDHSKLHKSVCSFSGCRAMVQW